MGFIFSEIAPDDVVNNEASLDSFTNLCHQSVWMWWPRVPEEFIETNDKRKSLGVSEVDLLILAVKIFFCGSCNIV